VALLLLGFYKGKQAVGRGEGEARLLGQGITPNGTGKPHCLCCSTQVHGGAG